MSLFKIVFNFIKKGPIALRGVFHQISRIKPPLYRFRPSLSSVNRRASTEPIEQRRNNPDRLFVPGEILNQKKILDEALRNRFPYLSGNHTDMLIRSEDHYTAEYIKRLLKPDPMNYGPKKPFKKWFESLNIQNINN